MTRRVGSPAADAAKGLTALAATVGLVVGVPAGLWAAVGWPLPATVPQWSDITRALSDTYVPDEFLLNALAVVCWVAWAQLTVALVVETLAALRRRPAHRVPLAGPLQTLAAHLVAAVLLLAALAGPRDAIAAPPLAAVELVAVDPAPTLLIAPVTSPIPVPPAAGDTEMSEGAEEAAPLPTYTVQRFDDLWSIAERHLADPYRWTEIWDLNRGRVLDGTTFRDPDLIQPSWTLDLPRDAIGLAPPPVAEPPVPEPPATETAEPSPGHADGPREDHDRGDRNAADTGLPSPTDAPSTASAPTPSLTASPAPTDPSTNAGNDRERRDSEGNDAPDDPPGAEVPTEALIALTLAAGIATSLAAARLHQRRRRLPAAPAPGIRHTEPLASEPVRRLQRAHVAMHATHDDDTAAGGQDEADGSAADGRMSLDPFDVGAIALTGPDDAARSILVNVLAAPRHGRTDVLLTRAVAQRLLPHTSPFPGLDIVDGLDVALTRLEIDLIGRTRLLDATGAADFAALIREHPEEPASLLLFVTDAPDPALQPRLSAVLSLGQRLGISALVLGPYPDLPSIAIADDGRVPSIDPAGAVPDLLGAPLTALSVNDATQLLHVTAAGRGDDPSAAPEEVGAEPFPAAPAAPTPPISVTLFGPPRIEARGTEIATGLRSKARELLAYFLLRPEGASLEAVVDALWPDVDPQRGVERFRTVLGNLRSTLRTAAGIDHAGIIDRLGERYQTDATLIDCDLWRFQAALTEATTGSDDAAVVAALQRATGTYRGDLVEGTYYDWAEAPREDLRRRAVDAAARLAELHERANDPEAALAVLEIALRHDPYTEELYRRTMRFQADLGRPDAVRRAYRLLETRLADLDVEPDQDTDRLLHDLLARMVASEGEAARTIPGTVGEGSTTSQLPASVPHR